MKTLANLVVIGEEADLTDELKKLAEQAGVKLYTF